MQQPELLDLRQVCRAFGGSKPLNPATIYRQIKAGLLPKQIKVAGSSRWLRTEVEACLKAMTEARQ